MLIPEPLPREGVRVPLRAAFTGIKGVPLLAVAHNNAAPVLELFRDTVRTRVIRAQRKPLSSIERVNCLRTVGTRNVEIIWRDSLFTFSGNVEDDDWLAAVLCFFRRCGVPLSDRARQYLDTVTNARPE
ncbi:MAG TPA: hypothetical protein VGW12_09530 [Pyrinomonadaceae bacterium]|nr:hypothetical protein [Pyrinomonadaceae bacterium]